MRVVVPDPALRRLLGSGARLRGRWPDGHQDVMVLIEVLRASGETLADAMLTGLVAIDTPQDVTVLGGLTISHRRARLGGIARGKSDYLAIDPHSHLARVHGISVLDVVVAGIASERRVG